jgi:plasmid stability protein
MADLVIRNVDEELLHSLEFKAQSKKIPLEEYIKSVLRESSRMTMEEYAETVQKIRESTRNPQSSDSVRLLREDRDR